MFIFLVGGRIILKTFTQLGVPNTFRKFIEWNSKNILELIYNVIYTVVSYCIQINIM